MNISDLSTPHDSQRWYHRDGSGLCSEVIGKTNGSPRPPTLRDARELGLLPGVTGICKIYPGALNWWSQDIRVAGEVGTRRHAIVETFHKFGAKVCAISCSPDDYYFVLPYIEWAMVNVSYITSTEKAVACLRLGYAGTMDLFCTLKRVGAPTAVVDLKNRKNPATYTTDAMQLAAYRRAVGADVGISVILGTDKPEILVKEWTEAEDSNAWESFQLCLQLFKRANNYWPELWKPKECSTTNTTPAAAPVTSLSSQDS